MKNFGVIGYGPKFAHPFGLLDNLFSDFFREVAQVQSGLARPAINVHEADEKYIVEAELPGVDLNDLDLAIMGRSVTISGEIKPTEIGEKDTFHRRERWGGKFTRSIELPCELNPDAVEATLVNGVLTLTLPKAEKALPRKIAIKGN
jgi:HSP20 family protein